MDPENGQTKKDAITYVVHFPVKSPEGTPTRNDVSAIEQCETWLRNKQYWTEHNPSCTVSYKEDEVIKLLNWVWDHRDLVGGLSFLPSSDAKYEQMPYEEITEAKFEELSKNFPEIDFSKLTLYEHKDMTTAAQEVACLSGACEIDFNNDLFDKEKTV